MVAIRNMMSRPVFTLPRDATVSAALRALCERGVSGAPVCDPKGRLLGVVSKGDLAEVLIGATPRAGDSVEDAMSVDVTTADAGEDAVAVARRMVFEGVHRVVVVGHDGEIVGIVAPLDLLGALVETGRPPATR